MLSEAEHDAVARAVHWFESVLLLWVTFLHEIDMFFVFVVVPADLPQLRMEYIGSYYFLIPSDFVLWSQQIYKPIENSCAVRVKERAPRR